VMNAPTMKLAASPGLCLRAAVRNVYTIKIAMSRRPTMKKIRNKVNKKVKTGKAKTVRVKLAGSLRIKPSKPVKAEKLPPKDRKKYKEKLILLKKNIIEELNKNLDDSKKIDFNEVKDSVDLASDTYDTEFLHNLSDSEKLQIESIESSLEKIENGSFGTCELCSKKINKVRLEALPHAKYCIECQTKTGG